MVIFTTIQPDPLLTLTRDFGPSESRMYFLKYIFKSFSLLIHFQHIVSPNSGFSEILKRKKKCLKDLYPFIITLSDDV